MEANWVLEREWVRGSTNSDDEVEKNANNKISK